MEKPKKMHLVLDLQLFAGEKTEPATPQKRRESRKKGQVAKSQELPGALILLFAFLSFYIFGDFMMERVYAIYRLVFENFMAMDITINNVMNMFIKLAIEAGLVMAPVLGTVVLMGLVGNYIQVGVMFVTEPLHMKFNKINPIEGFKKIFSAKTIVELLKSILKLTIIGVVVYFTIIGEKNKILALSSIPLTEIFSYVGSITLSIGVKIGALLLALSVLDYMFQKYDFEKSIRMSKQEIKEEFKKTEGDPLIKGKIKEKQRQMAMQRMMADVPKADVIITNPTHFAVAIQYNQTEMETPMVIAKGVDHTALKIREVAKENNVTIMENKPLARALYAQVEIGKSIPPDLFAAVAEILAYVYKLRKKR